MSDELFIDGFGPIPVHRPASVNELCELVRAARAAGQGVYPVGGRTTLDLGNVPSKPGIAVDTRSLNGVIDHAARDMTITVQAGITLAELAKVLAAENQWLPIDVPNPDQATLGGAIAANISGPRRLGHGTFRDYILGISFVTDDGVEVKGGGRVVKNVAGYDLMKLHTGALGTLGVITQVTLKVKPRPEATAVVSFELSEAAIGPTLDRLHASESRPMAVEVLNSAAAKLAGLPVTTPWLIVCGFEEKAGTVDWQVTTLAGELRGGPVRDTTVLTAGDATRTLAAVSRLQSAVGGGLTVKANVRPSSVAFALGLLGGVRHEPVVFAHAGNGIVWAHLAEEMGLWDAGIVTASTQKECREGGHGNLTVRRAPPDWKKTLRVWGDDHGDRELMRAIKRTLDPDDVFNPGRLV